MAKAYVRASERKLIDGAAGHRTAGSVNRLNAALVCHCQFVSATAGLGSGSKEVGLNYLLLKASVTRQRLRDDQSQARGTREISRQINQLPAILFGAIIRLRAK
jgi:hypothetical protein